MCGFLCVVSRKALGEAVDVPGLDRNILRHRGPDSTGDLVFPHAYVRHWRLSIVDLSEQSNQPYGDGASWLVYNGEIYNWAQMARRLSVEAAGDTSLLHELCKRRIEADELPHVRGFYSYLYLSDDGLAFSGGRDPFGKKPLLYYVNDDAGLAVFASEERAILDTVGALPVDFASVSQYLLYKQVFHGASYFQGIRQLAPGARFTFDVRRWTMSVDRDWEEYYRLPAARVFSLGSRSGIDDTRRLESEVHERLQESLLLRVPADVTACVALSGGVDSAVLAGLVASDAAASQISQFVTVGFQEPGCDESSRATAIASALSITAKHSVVAFREQEMLAHLRACVAQASAPLEHPHYLSYYVLCQYAAHYAKVLITGEGADELFMGYEHYREEGASFAFREYLHERDEAGFTSSSDGRPLDAVRRAAGIEHLREAALGSRQGSREYELKSHLLTLLSRNDKMGMAHSVEIRAPFLDPEVLALALTLDESALIQDGRTKHVLRQLCARRFPALDVQHKKIGFRVPFDEMFLSGRHRSDVRGYCEIAAQALYDECGIQASSFDTITPRLGWSLLNIGVFLDAHK